MFRKVLLVAMLTVIASSMALAPICQAQMAIFDHKLEIHGLGGYVWSSSQSISFQPPPQGLGTGDLDLKSSPWWGIAVDFNLPAGGQVELLYTRQDTDLTFKNLAGITTDVGQIAAEFWHIGGLYTRFSRGKAHPFTSFTLGATRLIDKTTNAGEIKVDDIWKFSLTLGLGVKAHLNERLGIRAQARMPWTFINSGAGLGFGTGGVSIGVGGSGIVGFDLSGGLFLML
jgi:opacity protein-like surface antigen